RGCIVTHNLYQPEELAKVRAEHGSGATVETLRSPAATTPPAADRAAPTSASPAATPLQLPPADGWIEMREQVAQLKREQTELRDELVSAVDSLRNDVEDLKRQLGI
ncbi:MAG: hypothetical protein AAF961_16320, partial [Planctomycetota bacterium]